MTTDPWRVKITWAILQGGLPTAKHTGTNYTDWWGLDRFKNEFKEPLRENQRLDQYTSGINETRDN